MMTQASRQKRNRWEEDHRRYDFIRIWGKRYAHMKARHDGKATNFSHSQGKGILSYDAFIEWCKEFENLDTFLALYFEWARTGFTKAFSPSVDRIDPHKGYLPGNLQWMSYAENCSKGNRDPFVGKVMA